VGPGDVEGFAHGLVAGMARSYTLRPVVVEEMHAADDPEHPSAAGGCPDPIPLLDLDGIDFVD